MNTKNILKVSANPFYWCCVLLLIGTSFGAWAQEGSQGNTTIFGGAEMTFFANHDFVAGGNGAQPGVILTDRTAGKFGVLNFSGTNLVSAGASDAGYVDGYVRKYGTGQFIFPVGDNNHLGQFAASADGTMGAYFYTNPTTAITSNLFMGSNYPGLPNGGPFPITSKGAGIKSVSDVEYWDIDGSNATPITLTWDANSNIGALTGNSLSLLVIVGWNGSQWVQVPATVDPTSILGGASTLTAGSITAVSTVPNTYTAYTFASIGPDLSPRVTVTPNVVHGTNVLEVVVSAQEVGGVSPTNGSPIIVRIRKNVILSNFIWNPATTMSTAGITVQNSIWTQTEDANYYIFTTSTVIPANSQRRLLFKATLTPNGANGLLSVAGNIPANGSGGETNFLNNQDADESQFFSN